MKATFYGPEEEESPLGMFRVEVETRFDQRFAFEIDAETVPSFSDPSEVAFFLEDMAKGIKKFEDGDLP